MASNGKMRKGRLGCSLPHCGCEKEAGAKMSIGRTLQLCRSAVAGRTLCRRSPRTHWRLLCLFTALLAALILAWPAAAQISFTDIGVGLLDVRYSSGAWGDYDNDGDLDILLDGWVADSTSHARVYRNDAGSFTDIGTGLPGGCGASVAWGEALSRILWKSVNGVVSGC
jgi:hypothetical protein